MKTAYPEFTKNRPRGTIVKKVRDTYYVYYAKSERVPGKKYPRQVVTGLAGKVDEMGFHEITRTVVDTEEFLVRECGFSNYLLLFEDTFVKEKCIKLKIKERRELYYALILNLSNNSYLNESKKLARTFTELCEIYQLNKSNVLASVERMIERKLDDIYCLKDIIFAKFGERVLFTSLTIEQKRMLDELGVTKDEICKN